MKFAIHLMLAAVAVVMLQMNKSVQAQSWTKWWNTDRPSGNADAECDICGYKKVCVNSGVLRAQCKQLGTVKVFTQATATVANLGDKLRVPCTTKGLMCFNRDQPNGRRCHDYAVRYLCNSGSQSWTKWWNTDRPSGNADAECDICGYKRVCVNSVVLRAECKQLSTGKIFTQATATVANVGDILRVPCTKKGLMCFNRDQPRGKRCHDYAVRYLCKSGPGSWTKWWNTDRPSGNADAECDTCGYKKVCVKTGVLRAQCKQFSPVKIFMQATATVANLGDKLRVPCTTKGLMCFNKDQPRGRRCHDYAVRYLCKPVYKKKCGYSTGSPRIQRCCRFRTRSWWSYVYTYFIIGRCTGCPRGSTTMW